MGNKYDILLCDLDAFFASVEILDHPGLKGKPLIVGGNPDTRGVVLTCSYEARKYGVHSAMPMKKALSLCPGAIVMKGRMRRYKQMAAQVMQVLENQALQIEKVSVDEAYLAVPRGAGEETARKIRRLVKEELNLPISIGVSTNKLLAKIACGMAKPDNLKTLFPQEVKKRLWPLSACLLPGVGPATEATLGRLGIKTIGQLAVFPLPELSRAVGSSAITLQGYANGIDHRHVEQELQAKSISEETTFPQNVFDDETMEAVLVELAAGVGYALRRLGALARTITLKLRFGNFRTITRAKTFTEPVDSDSVIFKTAIWLFRKHKGKPPWRLIGLQVSALEKEEQLKLFEPTGTEEKENILTKTSDRLHKKFGAEVLFRASRLKKKEPF